MAEFDKLKRAGFGGLEFPIRSCRMKCTYRVHQHVYLKTPGAALEKMCRTPYRVDMEIEFDTDIQGYGSLWPNTLASLRALFEQGVTAPLVVPTVGSFPCVITEWEQVNESRLRSGEHVHITLEEDNTVAFLAAALAGVSSASVESTNEGFVAVSRTIEPRPDIFDDIQEAVNDVLGFVDQVQLKQNLLAAKIEGLAALIQSADRTVQQLQDPSNFPVVYALQDLLLSTIELLEDITQQQGEARVYTVPMTMSVGAISFAIYGDTSHFDELVSNNRIDDPFAVPAGTALIYFTGGLLKAA